MTTRLTITAATGLSPNTARRTLSGTLFRYGEVGHTSAGPLAVAPGAIAWPADPSTLPLTLEHDRGTVRGHVLLIDDTPERVYVVVQVDPGPAGDAALAEAANRKRAAFSFDVDDSDVEDGVIVHAIPAAIGQVRDPAFNSARIDKIAASKTPGATLPGQTKGTNMTPEQIARLAALRELATLTDDERAELDELTALESGDTTAAADPAPAAAPAPAPVPATTAARRVPAVPGGVPRGAARTAPRPNALQSFYDTVTRALSPGGGGAQAITAAFSDVTSTANPAIEAPAWSGELWSGLQYEPEWSPLFSQGDLTSWEGSGWRWVTKPAMADYPGDKTAVPSAAISTEPSSYEAARMACGHDFDRKFYDFPNAAFLQSYAEAAREDWAVKLDAKVRAYVIAQAVTYGAVTTSLLKAAALATFGVKKNTKARATFVAVSEADFLDLLDVSETAVPAFLDTFNIDPGNFLVDDTIAAGTVIAGVKQAATVRTLPGSPIRIDAQHLANGGVDTAFFGYWAVEEHHTTGIVKTTFA